jgi:hypothetical protein
MTNPEPKTYNELLTVFDEVRTSAEQIGRLKALMDVANLLSVIASKSNSKIEIRTLEAVLKEIEVMK